GDRERLGHTAPDHVDHGDARVIGGFPRREAQRRAAGRFAQRRKAHFRVPMVLRRQVACLRIGALQEHADSPLHGVLLQALASGRAEENASDIGWARESGGGPCPERNSARRSEPSDFGGGRFITGSRGRWTTSLSPRGTTKATFPESSAGRRSRAMIRYF